MLHTWLTQGGQLRDMAQSRIYHCMHKCSVQGLALNYTAPIAVFCAPWLVALRVCTNVGLCELPGW